MAGVAQLVRALDCGSGGRGFETHHSPHNDNPTKVGFLFIASLDFELDTVN